MAYLMAVDGEPEAAVAEAVRRFIRGEVKRDRHTFLPSTAELAIEVRSRAEYQRLVAKRADNPMLLYPHERQQIEAPVSPEVRAKVGALMAGLAVSLSETGKPRAEPEADLADMAMDTSGLQFSATLRDAIHHGVGVTVMKVGIGKPDSGVSVQHVEQDEWRAE